PPAGRLDNGRQPTAESGRDIEQVGTARETNRLRSCLWLRERACSWSASRQNTISMDRPMDPIFETHLMQTRRQFFGSGRNLLGSAALASLLGGSAARASSSQPIGPH